MRSLAINYTFDAKVIDAAYQNQYEFGDAFMVAPFESGKDYGKIYFPAGTWYNLYSGEMQQGGHEKIILLKIKNKENYLVQELKKILTS